jgi:hypothetical protein
MTESMTGPAGSQTAFISPPSPARLGPLLGWLVGRSGLDDEGFATVAFKSPDAVAPGANDPVRLAEALTAAGLPAIALALVAAALPPREGVWWAWLSVRDALNVVAERAVAPPPPGQRPAIPPPAVERVALAALERWIADPSDANRRAAWDAGQAADLSSPAGCACAAAFFTSGSIAAPQSPMAVPPPAGAHAVMAATAVLLAAVRADPGNLPRLVSAAVAQAGEITRRLGGWETAAAAARQHFDLQREQHGAAVAAATPPMPPAQ